MSITIEFCQAATSSPSRAVNSEKCFGIEMEEGTLPPLPPNHIEDNAQPKKPKPEVTVEQIQETGPRTDEISALTLDSSLELQVAKSKCRKPVQANSESGRVQSEIHNNPSQRYTNTNTGDISEADGIERQNDQHEHSFDCPIERERPDNGQ